MVRMLEPDKLKLWILRAVVEGSETSRDVYDYVCSLGYPGSDKAVVMDLKRYANHGLIQREKAGGRYRYTPNGVTSDLHDYLELWEDELIESPTQNEKELMFWFQVCSLHLQAKHDGLGDLMAPWFYRKPWQKRGLLLGAMAQAEEDLEHTDFDARYLKKLYDDLMLPLDSLPAWMAADADAPRD